MKPFLRVLTLITLTMVFALAVSASPVAQPLGGEEAVVVNVIDGDTIDVRFPNGDVQRVRYIGIDTAERGDTCWTEGTAANVDLVNNQSVVLVKDVSETDRYGRLLRYVFVDGLLVNAELVRLGVAEAVEYPPDTARADVFEALEREAAQAGRGCLNSGSASGGSTETLYVTGNNINVRSCEQTDCRVVTTLSRGTPVAVLGSVQGGSVSGNTSWYQVRLADGSTAYIHSSLLGSNRPVAQPTARPSGSSSGSSGSGSVVSTPVPAQVSTPVPPPPGPSFACDCSKTCGAMASCDEAYFQLRNCGCGRRDGDGDGVPCEDICPGG